jgi:hypothetical protein
VPWSIAGADVVVLVTGALSRTAREFTRHDRQEERGGSFRCRPSKLSAERPIRS